MNLFNIIINLLKNNIMSTQNNKKIKVHDLGLVDYKFGLNYQKGLINRIKKDENHLIFLEHNKTITVGTKGTVADILFTTKQLENDGFSIIKTDRGGQVTIHNKGQLVVYPLVQLKEFELKPVDYVRRIEIMIVDFLKEIGIDSKIIIGKTGVWIDSFNKQRKIVAIGVRVSGGITMHGFALNIDNDLGDFNSIIPCGLPESEATSLKRELKSDIDKSDIKSKLINSFEKIFDCEVIVG
ncbi:MAG: hypothetical protein CL762_03000 [Chloroflexi bacterium]|nr:hypothetical protein [Chloroflexota bacterium]